MPRQHFGPDPATERECQLRKIFFIPILFGILLGTAFPYQSLSLISLSSALLFALMFFNGLTIDWSRLPDETARGFHIHSAVQLLLFLFFPTLNTALAAWLLSDQDLLLGFVFCSLAPTAMVAPYFARARGGNAEHTMAAIVFSTVLCPLVTFPLASFLAGSAVFVSTSYMFYFLFLITVIPLALSWICWKYLPRASLFFQKRMSVLNSLTLAALMFILVGSSMTKFHANAYSAADLMWLVLLLIWLDFGVYFIVKRAFGAFVPLAASEAAAISVSLRNVAIPASVLLFFHSKAALPAAIGLCVHAFFFQWLIGFKTPAKARSESHEAFRSRHKNRKTDD